MTLSRSLGVSDPAGGDQSPYLCPGGTLRHTSPLLNQSHREAFSAASRMSLVALRLCRPQIPWTPRTQYKDLPAKPLQSISIASQQAFHPFLWHSATRSTYFAKLNIKMSNIKMMIFTLSVIRLTMRNIVIHAATFSLEMF